MANGLIGMSLRLERPLYAIKYLGSTLILKPVRMGRRDEDNMGAFFEDLSLRLKRAHCTRKYLGYTTEKTV